MFLTRFIKNVVKDRMESIFAIAGALIVLFTAIMDPYISFGIAVTLLVALEYMNLSKDKNKRRGYLNG